MTGYSSTKILLGLDIVHQNVFSKLSKDFWQRFFVHYARLSGVYAFFPHQKQMFIKLVLSFNERQITRSDLVWLYLYNTVTNLN